MPAATIGPGEWTKIISPSKGHIRQDGQAVQAFAIHTMSSLVCALKTEDDTAESTFFIGHQANKVARETIRKRVGIPEGNHLFNVDWFGNCGAAGAPSVLSQNWEKFTPGQSALGCDCGRGIDMGQLQGGFCQRGQVLRRPSAR